MVLYILLNRAVVEEVLFASVEIVAVSALVKDLNINIFLRST